MNGKQTKDALYSIASEREQEYIVRLAALDFFNKTEKKVLRILLNYTRNCAGFARMDYMGNGYVVREKQIRDLHVFDDYLSYLDTLKGDSKDAFMIYTASFSMVYSNFYVGAKAIIEKGTASVEEAFEAKLKFDCTREILTKWADWWKENGCVNCEVAL